LQISALTDIVEGKLLNSPSISFITQIHTNVNKINEGDAFLATNEKDISLAIKKGAFGIISQFSPNIVDEEIAWIKVDNIQKAITNTLRYKLVQYKISFVYVDKVFFHLLEVLKTKDMNEILLLSDNIYKEFETLQSIEENKIVFCFDRSLLKAISPNITELNVKTFKINNLTNHSLFENSFSYKNMFFDKVKLPYLYINHILTLQELFQYKLDFKRLTQLKLFEPIFINKSSQIVSFGQTNRFIIANSDSSIYKDQIKYIYDFYKYGDIKILETINLGDNEIYEFIKNNKFNALYIKDKNISQIENILQQNDISSKLF
jgi:ferrochelatase